MRRFEPILIVALVLSAMRLGLPAFAATGRSVDDESGLLSADTIAQIDARNEQLRDATGVIVAVLIVPGSNGETESALRTRADALFKDKYGALLYVSISPEVTDIIFADQGMKWISDGQRTALRNDLVGNLRYCCPGETVPAMVDKIATAMETGSREPVTTRNYVNDRISLLTGYQIAAIAAREQVLEKTTAKGIAVETLNAEQGKLSSVAALRDALTLNVKGDVAEIIWIAKSPDGLNFNVMQSPADQLLSEPQLQTINSQFAADLRSGDYGAAIVSAVDRTATALEAVATPPATQAAQPATVSPAAEPTVSQAAEPQSAATPPPPPRANDSNAAAIVVLLVLALLLLAVFTAARHARRGP